jgi:single-strand selective monofunctional uracil DNA glycosylase
MVATGKAAGGRARHRKIVDALVADLAGLRFGPPVRCVYNPLIYARAPYEAYWERYGSPGKEVVLLGMNPGPWGMAQTGVPFGDVALVENWLGVRAPVMRPRQEHPARPVKGFKCTRREVSGRRLWGWARDRFGTPEAFFARFFVANYCPLVFMEESGRNRTPDKLKAAEKAPLLAACDRALQDTVDLLEARMVVGVGKFAAARAAEALQGKRVTVGSISHPSPANPRANQGWSELASRELVALGVAL